MRCGVGAKVCWLGPLMEAITGQQGWALPEGVADPAVLALGLLWLSLNLE